MWLTFIEVGYYSTMFILWLIAVALVIWGIVTIVRGNLILGIVLIVLGLLVGPGGVSIFDDDDSDGNIDGRAPVELLAA